MKFSVMGNNMQSLKVDLDRGDRFYADSGKLISKTTDVIMTPRLVGGIIGAFKRTATGATAMLTEFSAKDAAGHAELAGVIPGKVFEVDLAKDQEFVAEHYAFLAAEDTVTFTIQVVGIGAALFGGEGWILQKFRGPGKVFIHVIGDIIEYDLNNASTVEIDPGHVAGFDGTLSYKIAFVDNIRTAMFGGIGLFLAKFDGTGRVITHSVSKQKLAAALFAVRNPKAKGV